MEKPKPDPKMVLEAVKDLPTSGILAQDGYSGMLFLDLDDEWIFKALPVIKDYGYISPPFFVFPPVPLGAHIRIITENEAIDYELVTERVGKKEIPGLGKTVNFKVVEAFSHHPELRTYGIESRYWIRVESEELDKIRMDLTGLPRPELGFCINVGVRLEDMPDESEEKPVETELTQSPPSSTSGDPQSSKCPVCLDSFVEIRDQRERLLPRFHNLRPRFLWTLSHLCHRTKWEMSYLQGTSEQEKLAQTLPVIRFGD